MRVLFYKWPRYIFLSSRCQQLFIRFKKSDLQHFYVTADDGQERASGRKAVSQSVKRVIASRGRWSSMWSELTGWLTDWVAWLSACVTVSGQINSIHA